MNDNGIYDMGYKDNKRNLGTDNKDLGRGHGKNNRGNQNWTFRKINKDKERTFVSSLENIHGGKEERKSDRQPFVINRNQDKKNTDNNKTRDSDNQRTSSKSNFSKEKVSRTNSFHTRNMVDSDSDNRSVTHDSPNVNNLRPVMGKNGPNINDTNIRNDNSNIDDTNIPKNGCPPFTVKFSVLIAVILILALFILPCCLYKAKSLNVLSRRNKLAPSENHQSTISQISTGVLSWQPRGAMSEVYIL